VIQDSLKGIQNRWSEKLKAMNSETREHLKNPSSWKRLLYILLFVILYNVAEMVLAVVVVLQVIMNLFTGGSNNQLLIFGKQLSRYIYTVMLYLTYNSNDLPFPFSPWPTLDAGGKVDNRFPD
jgi:hypothetical protein